ncbi:M48 family peptidase [Alginatibacterium sediminis]|uniref:Putative beta-barrel assembly-enhancing protease n=1 Tax=Alginatibacterium sediminis TaxID=2164068 RepID=A0A420EC01_9ALTE|nr:M48 family metalloprotease [Alginatibacterium sediminis]RKF18162.1 M48 family peptidase [Alginatibacterium sediminis]
MIRIRSLLLAFVLSSSIFSSAQADIQIPQIGTAGASALSIEKELQFGAAYMRIIRAGSRMTNDPVLSEYVDELGHKLVANAEQVRTPFTFFMVTNDEINAAAFLGGHVMIHTGLFLNASNESELASVLAHEIAHVTQRHIARSIENQAANQNLTIAGMVGALLLGLANPAAGIAVFQSTVAANMQNSINYTRSNEFEADRIGIRTLANAGYDPTGMSDFFGKLADKYRFASKPPQMLVTHPLPDTRVAEARARANQMGQKYVPPSLNYQFAKSRIIVRHGTMDAKASLSHFERALERKEFVLKDAALYGKALALFANERYSEAKTIISDLDSRHPNNLFLLDTLSDIDLSTDNTSQAIKRLERANKRFPLNQVVVLNLAVAYQSAKQYEQAESLLVEFLHEHPDNVLAWSQRRTIEQRLGKTAQSHVSRAEYLALHSDYQRAIDELYSAFSRSESTLERARIEARIEQFKLAEQKLQEF